MSNFEKLKIFCQGVTKIHSNFVISNNFLLHRYIAPKPEESRNNNYKDEIKGSLTDWIMQDAKKYEMECNSQHGDHPFVMANSTLYLKFIFN